MCIGLGHQQGFQFILALFFTLKNFYAPVGVYPVYLALGAFADKLQIFHIYIRTKLYIDHLFQISLQCKYMQESIFWELHGRGALGRRFKENFIVKLLTVKYFTARMLGRTNSENNYHYH